MKTIMQVLKHGIPSTANRYEIISFLYKTTHILCIILIYFGSSNMTLTNTYKFLTSFSRNYIGKF
jgi:hypothetical protein